MVEWLWVVGVALAVTAIQLLLYRRIQEEQPLDNQSVGQDTDPPSAPGDSDGSRSRGDDRLAGEERGAHPDPVTSDTQDGRRCPTCGAVNATDDAFTYCHNCIEPLA